MSGVGGVCGRGGMHGRGHVWWWGACVGCVAGLVRERQGITRVSLVMITLYYINPSEPLQ